METKLRELWSKIPESEDALEKSVLELLMQGKKEDEICRELHLTSSYKWPKYRTKFLAQLNFVTGSRGHYLIKLPSESDAEYVLTVLNSTLVVAYSSMVFDVDEVDIYLTFLTDTMGFDVSELPHCTNDEIELLRAVNDEYIDLEKKFTLLLGDVFTVLNNEIRKDKKRPVEKHSGTYNSLMEDYGFLRGESMSLRYQLDWFKKNLPQLNEK